MDNDGLSDDLELHALEEKLSHWLAANGEGYIRFRPGDETTIDGRFRLRDVARNIKGYLTESLSTQEYK